MKRKKIKFSCRFEINLEMEFSGANLEKQKIGSEVLYSLPPVGGLTLYWLITSNLIL